MTHALKIDDFWTGLAHVQAGMLSLGDARPIPMSHYPDRENRALWFIAAAGSAPVEALSSGPADARYILASQAGQIYAHVTGRAALSEDSDKLDEFWNAVAASWFEDGRRDDDVRLIRLDLDEAEVWTTTGKLGFLFEIAKAHASGDQPDTGAHGKLTFDAPSAPTAQRDEKVEAAWPPR